MEWPRLLANITGRVDKELLVRNEYLAAENRILRVALAEIAHRLGRQAWVEVAYCGTTRPSSMKTGPDYYFDLTTWCPTHPRT